MADVFKIKGRNGVALSTYYGKIKVAPKRWERVQLFTDKASSRKELAKQQTAADQRRSGMATPDTDRLQLPVAELAKNYVESLRRERCDGEHIRIVTWHNDRLIELGGWKFFADITSVSMERILAALESEGATASYRNKFIARAKAFVNWALPTDWPSPLGRLKRIREKGAKRPASDGPPAMRNYNA